MIPDVSSFCLLLEEAAATYLEKAGVQTDGEEESEELEVFILKQLLQILSKFDCGHDEIGQRKVRGLMVKLLQNEGLCEDLVEHCVQVLKRVSISESDFSRHLVALVSEVSMPPELQQLEAERRVIQACGVGQEEARNTLGEEISAVRQELESIATDSQWRFYRGLTITAALLRNLGPGQEVVELDVLMERIVLPGLQHELALVRLMACECLGLFGLLSRSEATLRLPVLKTLLETDVEDTNVRAAALKSLFDMVMVHGLIEQGEDDELLLLLLTSLEDEDEKLRLIAAEGLAKV